MTRVFVLLLAIVSVVLGADRTDAVREAAQGWREGAVKQDKALLQKFLANDLVYTHGGGKRQTKAEYITDVTQGPAHYDSFSASGTNVRIYGNVAVLTGIVDVKPAKGEPYRVRTFEVYTEHGGTWQLAQKESARITASR